MTSEDGRWTQAANIQVGCRISSSYILLFRGRKSFLFLFPASFRFFSSQEKKRRTEKNNKSDGFEGPFVAQNIRLQMRGDIATTAGEGDGDPLSFRLLMENGKPSERRKKTGVAHPETHRHTTDGPGKRKKEGGDKQSKNEVKSLSLSCVVCLLSFCLVFLVVVVVAEVIISLPPSFPHPPRKFALRSRHLVRQEMLVMKSGIERRERERHRTAGKRRGCKEMDGLFSGGQEESAVLLSFFRCPSLCVLVKREEGLMLLSFFLVLLSVVKNKRSLRTSGHLESGRTFRVLLASSLFFLKDEKRRERSASLVSSLVLPFASLLLAIVWRGRIMIIISLCCETLVSRGRRGTPLPPPE